MMLLIGLILLIVNLIIFVSTTLMVVVFLIMKILVFSIMYFIVINFNFMELISKLWVWIKTLPIWLRAIVFVLLAALAFIMSMVFVSCGTTRAVVHNGAYGTSTEIRITTNNPTSVTASPNVELIPN